MRKSTKQPSQKNLAPGVVKCPIHSYETVGRIASWLTKKDLGACVLVSKDWSHWFVPFLWQSIKAKTLPEATSLLKQALRHHGHHIRHLSVYDCASESRLMYYNNDLGGLKYSLRTLVYDKPWIERLTRLRIVSWTPFERQVLSVIYRNSQTLRELRFEYLEQDWLRGQDLPEMPRLQTLELGNFNLTKDRLRKLILAKCPKLETLGLVCVNVLPKDTVVPPRGRPDLDQFVRTQSHNVVRDGEGRPRAGDVRIISSSAKQRLRQQGQKTNLGKSNPTSHLTPRTSKDDQYVRGVKRYLVYDKVYAVLDLFPDLESIVFRPEKPFHPVWDWPPTSGYEEMIKSTCHNLHSLTVETFPPHRETWGCLIRSMSQLTHLSLEGIADYDRMIVEKTIQYHFPMLESVHVGTSMTNPAIILQFLEKCPRLRKWSCSENVIISATSLKMSLQRVDRRTHWVCEEMREMIWPKNVAGFGPQEIDRLVASLQNKSATLKIEPPSMELLAIETPAGLQGQEEKGVSVSRTQRDSETESRERIFKLMLSALESMKHLKFISFGSQMHRIE